MWDSKVQWTHSLLVQQELKECCSQQFSQSENSSKKRREEHKWKWGRVNHLILPHKDVRLRWVWRYFSVTSDIWRTQPPSGASTAIWYSLSLSLSLSFSVCVCVNVPYCMWKCFVAGNNSFHAGRKTSVCVCVCVCECVCGWSIFIIMTVQCILWLTAWADVYQYDEKLWRDVKKKAEFLLLSFWIVCVSQQQTYTLYCVLLWVVNVSLLTDKHDFIWQWNDHHQYEYQYVSDASLWYAKNVCTAETV